MADQGMLQLGPDLRVPRDLITQTLAILSITGAGKSNAGAVIAEEMYAGALPFVAIDPKGDWWGLRSSGDGNGPGLPVPIFGGLHGDLPLLPESGKLIADLIFDQNLTCILDVSEFDSKAAQMRFLADFGAQLFRRHGKKPQARHLILEEADEFLPQVVRAEQARCVGAWTKIVKQGRQRGLGITIISQRSAVVNKDALSQCANLLALRTVGALDRKAILEWIRYHEMANEIVNSLPGLADGEAWMCSPQWLPKHGQQVTQRFAFQRRWTFDSGATPEIGEVRRPATLADIDLAAVQASMTAVIDKAAQDDPAALRRKVAELERSLATRGSADPGAVAALKADNASLRAQLAEAQNRPPERVEVPVLAPGDIAAAEQIITAMQSVAASLELALSQAIRAAPVPIPARQVPTPKPAPLEPRRAAPTLVAGEVSPAALGKRERAILTVLVQFPAGRTHRQIALLTGYSPKASTISAGLATLRKRGYVSPGGNPVLVTQDGIDALGEVELLPTGPALLDYWNGQLGARERALLAVLLERYPDTVSHAEMAEITGYSPDASTISAGMSRLRGLGLADGWVASHDFVEAIQAREMV